MFDVGETFPELREDDNRLLKSYVDAIQQNESVETIESASEKLRNYIISKVDEAIDKLYDNDIDLIKTGMNEMTLSGRLAFYLQRLFEDFHYYYVDVEYYRLKVNKGEVRDRRKDRIRCDILLHTRGKYHARVDNLLAIEIKLEKSDDDGNSDLNRLAEFVVPMRPDTPEGAIHSTLVGLFCDLV